MKESEWQRKLLRTLSTTNKLGQFSLNQSDIQEFLTWLGYFSRAQDDFSIEILEKFNQDKIAAQYYLIELADSNLLSEPVDIKRLFGTYPPGSSNIRTKLKARYSLLARIFHPDRHMHEQAFLTDCMKRINDAFSQTHARPDSFFYDNPAQRFRASDVSKPVSDFYSTKAEDQLQNFQYHLINLVNRLPGFSGKSVVLITAILLSSYLLIVIIGAVQQKDELERLSYTGANKQMKQSLSESAAEEPSIQANLKNSSTYNADSLEYSKERRQNSTKMVADTYLSEQDDSDLRDSQIYDHPNLTQQVSVIETDKLSKPVSDIQFSEKVYFNKVTDYNFSLNKPNLSYSSIDLFRLNPEPISMVNRFVLNKVELPYSEATQGFNLGFFQIDNYHHKNWLSQTIDKAFSYSEITGQDETVSKSEQELATYEPDPVEKSFDNTDLPHITPDQSKKIIASDGHQEKIPPGEIITTTEIPDSESGKVVVIADDQTKNIVLDKQPMVKNNLDDSPELELDSSDNLESNNLSKEISDPVVVAPKEPELVAPPARVTNKIFGFSAADWVVQLITFKSRLDAMAYIEAHPLAVFCVPIIELTQEKFVIINSVFTNVEKAQIQAEKILIGKPRVRQVSYLQQHFYEPNQSDGWKSSSCG